MRWEDEAEEAVGGVIVDRAGIDDYQGWGALLSKRSEDDWAVISWSYGSCDLCDPYEEMRYYNSDGLERVIEAMKDLVEEFSNEKEARMCFESRKGW